MAEVADIQKAFNIVLGAGLEFPPSQEEVKIRAFSWCELLTDVPGDCLIQAAKDIANNGERFPSVARIRKQSETVKSRNGKGKASAFEAPYVRPQNHDYLDGEPVTVIDHHSVMVVAPDGWQLWQPGMIEPVKFPSAFEAECARLEAKYPMTGDALPANEEFAYLESLRGI